MNYWEKDDIDRTSWESAMFIALRSAKYFNRKHYVWAYKSRRDAIKWVVSETPPTQSWDEAYP